MGSSDRILSAAENIFARFGFRRASMSQIAEEAGLTRQALYHHYSSKEALFRAVVEQLHECAYEAEAAAGLEQEQAGGGLADILAAQIGARFRYLIECVEESPQADELMSEHQLQTRDLYQSFVEHNADLRAETIDRVCTRQDLALQNGMTSRDLARCIQTAIRGCNNLRLDTGLLRELDRMVRLLVAGAIAPAASQSRAKRRSR
ncbi:helix-turn-helix domain-containing protein [Bradyrhizobium sp.]|jgi:AcrR family transcriptional regulator|uniref:TetR/AcrR family transcriptional regulator n=2 Tax=Bradyrhizobium sp. TaxID=376 RepID=UPI003BE0585D